MTVQLIRLTAKDLAGAFYEEDRSDRFRKLWPDVRQFTARNWPNFVPMARAILTGMLDPHSNTVQSLKDEIYEALIEDHRRSQGQRGVKVGMGLKLRPDQPGTLEQKVFHDGK